MGSKSVIRSMSERDPFLRENLKNKKYQADIHVAYLQLSQSISDLLRPMTPDEEIPESRGKDTTGRKTRRRSIRSALSNCNGLEKYSKYSNNAGIEISGQMKRPSWNRPSSNRSQSSKWEKQKIPLAKRRGSKQSPPKRPPSSADPNAVKYSIRYSKVLDIFKRKIYRDIIANLGIDINSLDDPSLVEIDLAWCKVGSYILESRENTNLTFPQFFADTASVVSGDNDDQMSLYSGYNSFLPCVTKGPRGPLKSPQRPEISKSPERKTSKSYNAEYKQSQVPKLPAIGEVI